MFLNFLEGKQKKDFEKMALLNVKWNKYKIKCLPTSFFEILVKVKINPKSSKATNLRALKQYIKR